MQLATDGVRFHSDTDEVFGAEHVNALGFGKGHAVSILQ
jgi:hypothetical protein